MHGDTTLLPLLACPLPLSSQTAFVCIYRDATSAVLNQTVATVWFSAGLLTVTAIIQSAMRTHVNVRQRTLTDTYNIWLFPTW